MTVINGNNFNSLNSTPTVISQGDSYLIADNNPISWTFPAGSIPSLEGATINVIIDRAVPTKTPPGTMSVPSIGYLTVDEYGDQIVSINLPSSATTNMGTGVSTYNVQIIATLTNGQVATILFTTMTVNALTKPPQQVFGYSFPGA